MLQQISNDTVRINARPNDAFDIFNLKHNIGANPYLDTGAFVFDFSLTNNWRSLPISDYIGAISQRYPETGNKEYQSHAELFADTVSEVAKLDMDLHLYHTSFKSYPKYTRIALQAIHYRTSKLIVYFVWDWFEAITQNRNIDFDLQLRNLQNTFRKSVYGGPTNYALLRTAYHKDIPTFYLWKEGLTQYGYGKKQVRGVATTFHCDSHLDSDFTTRKDDCKAFLNNLGFPVPKGNIVTSRKQALIVAKDIGYPVAIKPVSGHKGMGVTADIRNSQELQYAYDRAYETIPYLEPICIIVEQSIKGTDFRLLCVNGKFVAAIERRAASIVGNGYSNIQELIEQENRKPERLDTPTSPMSQIQCDEAMEQYLSEQNLSLNSVPKKDSAVYLRKVANLSAGGVSIDATTKIHPDNIILAQDIAQHFHLTCLGIDVMTENLAVSWKEGNFAILEINAAPGIMMHLNPVVGEGVDVPSSILDTFFANSEDAKIPIITFNKISLEQLQETIDSILLQHPEYTVGGVCRDAVLINQSQKIFSRDYNTNVQSLLRNPNLDLLIVEYDEDILENDGMFYQKSNIVILDNPSEIEMLLAKYIFNDSTVITQKQNKVTIARQGLIEEHSLTDDKTLPQLYLKEISEMG